MNGVGGVPITQHGSPEAGVPNAYPVPPILNLTIGIRSVVPFPTNMPRSAVPTHLPHVVINNASAYTLLVDQGGTPLAQIPAFTADDIVVQLVGTESPVGLTPLQTTAVINSSADRSVYATWYSSDPPGVYPVAIGAGSIPLSQSTNLVDAVEGVAISQGTYNPNVQSWMQAIAIQIVQSGGTANGFYVSSTLLGANAVGSGQWLYLPVNGVSVLPIVVDTLLNGVNGGNFTGTVKIIGLAGPIPVPVYGALAPTIGRQSTVVVVAAATGSLIARPPTGFVWRMCTFGYRNSTAPVVNGTVTFRGSVSGATYTGFGGFGATTFSGLSPGPIYFYNSGQLDPAEGIDVANASGGTISAFASLDLVPPPIIGY